MLLSPGSVQWLTSQLGATVQAGDLESTYSFVHQLNASRNLALERISESSEVFFRWWIEFYTEDRLRVLEVPLARMVYPEHDLESRHGRDHVAFNSTFFVAPNFQRQGLASEVYDAEERLYRRWNIAEIQIHAIGDGCVVWVKKFGFELKDPEVYQVDFPGWARMNHLSPIVPTRAADYPEAFLRSRQELHVFKVLR